MLLRTTYTNLEKTDAIEAAVQKKIGGKINRFAKNPIDGHLFLSVEPDGSLLTLTLKDQQGDDIVLKKQHDDMYAAIHELALSLETVLVRRKEKRMAHRHDKPEIDLESLES